MPQNPETTSVATGVVGLLAGSMLGPVAADLWRKIKGTEYATKADCLAHHTAKNKECQERHDHMKEDCTACKAATKASICAIQHEGAKNRRLLLLIAIKLQVPQEELKEYL